MSFVQMGPKWFGLNADTQLHVGENQNTAYQHKRLIPPVNHGGGRVII